MDITQAQFSTFRDRKDWGSGPWDSEPDRVAWKDRGVHCIVLRNDHGAWCGYIAVPPGHPWHGRDESTLNDVMVHGALTYSAACFGDEQTGVCHKPEPGEPDDVWWLGFDCCHAFDLVPAFNALNERRGLDRGRSDVYRPMEYVMDQVKGLVDQLFDVEPPSAPV